MRLKHEQITEKHLSDILVSSLPYVDSKNELIQDTISNAKTNGYVKKSPVEEIKERYINFINSKTGMIKREHFDLINDQHAIIFDLEKQIEELQNGTKNKF